MFGSIMWYYNLGKSRKFIRDKTAKGILMGYKGDTIYYILKSNGHIAHGAAI
jgi:hypothetical protein